MDYIRDSLDFISENIESMNDTITTVRGKVSEITKECDDDEIVDEMYEIKAELHEFNDKYRLCQRSIEEIEEHISKNDIKEIVPSKAKFHQSKCSACFKNGISEICLRCGCYKCMKHQKICSVCKRNVCSACRVKTENSDNCSCKDCILNNTQNYITQQ